MLRKNLFFHQWYLVVWEAVMGYSICLGAQLLIKWTESMFLTVVIIVFKDLFESESLTKISEMELENQALRGVRDRLMAHGSKLTKKWLLCS